MAISDLELTYDHHLAFHRDLGLLVGDADRDAHWLRDAERGHFLSVLDAARDCLFDAATLAERVDGADANAALHLRFGLARRVNFIWLSMRELWSTVPPDRTEPLEQEQVDLSARALNTVYVNLRGALDNLAACLIGLFGQRETRELPPARMSLFGRDFLGDKNLADFAEIVGRFSDWNREMSRRRDPAAHRIPLSVPPTVLDQTSQEEYHRVNAEWNDARVEAIKATGSGAGNVTALFERADLILAKLRRIGTFVPIFLHHPSDGPIRIYPVVPEDVGAFIRLNRALSVRIGQSLD